MKIKIHKKFLVKNINSRVEQIVKTFCLCQKLRKESNNEFLCGMYTSVQPAVRIYYMNMDTFIQVSDFSVETHCSILYIEHSCIG